MVNDSLFDWLIEAIEQRREQVKLLEEEFAKQCEDLEKREKSFERREKELFEHQEEIERQIAERVYKSKEFHFRKQNWANIRTRLKQLL